MSNNKKTSLFCCCCVVVYIAVCICSGFPGGALVKNPPANAGDARDPGSTPSWKDPLEKEIATHCSILAWRIPWTEEPDGLQSMGSQSQTQLSN